MDEKALIRLNRYIDQMPSLSITVSKILEVTRNPQVTAKDLNKVISLDPVLVGRVLKLVNSAYYGLQNKVTSLVTAIIMLGINTIKNLALSTAVLANMKKGSHFKALNVDGFWRHSIGVGVASKLIAGKIGVPINLREQFFIGGLLHDLGKIPLNVLFNDEYIRVIRTADFKKIGLIEAEKNILGITHTEVGRMIAEKWRLTDENYECILHHHSPDLASKENAVLVSVVSIANVYCDINQIGFSGNRYAKMIDHEMLREVGVTEEYLDDLFESISSEIEKASIFLQV